MHFNLRILNPIAMIAVALLLASSLAATTSKSQPTKSTTSASSSHKSSTSSKSSKSAKTSSSKSKQKSAKATSHGQHGIDQERALAIQQALVREHYLSGEPTGKWDQDTKDALVRFQAENGWQTKVTPDSRALIKLGLGPDKKGLLNPDTAVMSSPHELGTQHDTVPGGSSQP